MVTVPESELENYNEMSSIKKYIRSENTSSTSINTETPSPDEESTSTPASSIHLVTTGTISQEETEEKKMETTSSSTITTTSVSSISEITLDENTMTTEMTEMTEMTEVTEVIDMEGREEMKEHRSSYSEIPTIYPRLPLRSPLPDEESEAVYIPLLCAVPIERLTRSKQIYEESFTDCV